MSEADRRKWDARYRAGSYAERRHPSALLAEWLPRLPLGSALDVACGAGRNALHLAAAGFTVDAVDISAAGLERADAEARRRGLNVRWIETDLEPNAHLEPGARFEPGAQPEPGARPGPGAPSDTGAHPDTQPSVAAADATTAARQALLPDRRYQVVVWIRYVNAQLMPLVIERLAPGGYLLCEQHLQSTHGEVAGPTNPAFRLAPGALRQWATGLHVLYYREGLVEDPDGRMAALAQLVARRDVASAPR